MDVDAFRPGDDFVEAIDNRLKDCDVVLVVIGARWLEAEEGGKSRLDNETDFVRIEIQAALERKIRVVPILVQGAMMPRREDLPEQLHGLVRRHALELSDTRWSFDVTRLIEGIQTASRTAAATPQPATASPGPSVSLAPVETLNDLQHRKNVVASVQVNANLAGKIDFSNLVPDSLAVSGDSRRFAWVSKNPKLRRLKQKFAVIVDGEASGEFDDIAIKTLGFSANSQRFAFVANSADKWRIVVDGSQEGLYDDILNEIPIFSPDGRRVAYGAGIGRKWTAVVDGQESGRYDGISAPVFSPDGRRVAYDACIGRKWTVVVDGQEGGRYDGILEGTPVFSPDGRLTYGARISRKWTLVVEDREGPLYDGFDPEVVFGPGGSRLGYVVRQRSKWLLIVEDHECLLPGPLLRGTRVAFDDNDTLRVLTVNDAGEVRRVVARIT